MRGNKNCGKLVIKSDLRQRNYWYSKISKVQHYQGDKTDFEVSSEGSLLEVKNFIVHNSLCLNNVQLSTNLPILFIIVHVFNMLFNIVEPESDVRMLDRYLECGQGSTLTTTLSNINSVVPIHP